MTDISYTQESVSNLSDLRNGDKEHAKYEKRDARITSSSSTKLTDVINGPTDGAASLGIQEDRRVFLLDSGASNYMLSCRDWIRSLEPIDSRGIILGDGSRVFATHRGKLVLRTTVGGPGKQCKRFLVLNEVLYVPQLQSNLIYCSEQCNHGYSIIFQQHKCNGLHDGVIKFQGRRYQGVYRISAEPMHSGYSSASLALSHGDKGEGSNAAPKGRPVLPVSSAMRLWYARLGHANNASIEHLMRSGAVYRMSLKKQRSTTESCDGCMKGKQTRQTLRPNKSRSRQRGAVINTDVCGPMSVASLSGARYFVSFIDDYTGFIKIVPIARKSYVTLQFKVYHAWIERRFGCTVKRVHSNNGGEYVGMRPYLQEKGIEHTTSPPYSPGQNGMDERSNRTIVECARTMMEHASPPKAFWAEAVVYAERIRNHFSCPMNRQVTSHELMTGEKPNVSYFRVFGCLDWYHVPKELRKKLDSKFKLGIVVGCFENSQYKLWIFSRNFAVTPRDVTIVVDKFPAHAFKQDGVLNCLYLLMMSLMLRRSLILQSKYPVQITSVDRNRLDMSNEHSSPTTGDHQRDEQDHSIELGTQEAVTYTPPLIDNIQDTVDSEQIEEILSQPRSPRRERRKPSYYDPGSTSVARAFSAVEIRKPDPTTVREAILQSDSEEWKAAIESELKSLKQHGTWEIVDTPERAKPLSTIFVFLCKYDEDGTVIRHKARLVVRSFLQGNVDQTFAPVVDFTTIRTCLVVAVKRGYYIDKIDIKTAFLHGEIERDVYIDCPEGISLCKQGQVLQLRKGLYGLKQASRL